MALHHAQSSLGAESELGPSSPDKARLVASEQEQRDLLQAIKSAKEAQETEFKVVKGVMEEVTDQEIDELRAR